ncbi:MAG: hypothetical protein WBE97_15055, partial [Candidatus Acidiferrales bacterium]
MPNDGQSWLGSIVEKAIDAVKPQSSLPSAPLQSPPVNQNAWNQSVEQTKVIDGLTVHQVGLSVFGETQSLSDLPSSNESIDAARQKVAQMIINGADARGDRRPSVHAPIEPSAKALNNPDVQAAYDSSMKAAREAFLSGNDPTQGAIYLGIPTNASRTNYVLNPKNPAGVQISTQSGPYHNSFTAGDVPSSRAWVNTYFPEKK